MAAPASISYPTLVVANPVVPNGGVTSGGTPNAPTSLPWQRDFSDQSIFGAAKINPAYAADFYAGKYKARAIAIGNENSPEVKSKPVAQSMATVQGPNAWKKRTLPKGSPQVMFGYGGTPQKLFKNPWAKQWIPPLAMFNDASQWVNKLMFNRPGDKMGNGNSDPPLKPAALGLSLPPIQTNNLAAGALNAQLQLGQMVNQAAQLSISASNYFGGS